MKPAKQRGFSLIEVLVSITIFVVGVVAIILFFPTSLRATRDAELLTRAALLAQQKASEIRRDDDTSGTLIVAIAGLDRPTDPIVFPQNTDLSYSFNGEPVLNRAEPSPESDSNVARVIIFRNADGVAPTIPAGYDPTTDNYGGLERNVLYELRFGP